MKGNTDKCHLILSKVNDGEIRVGESLIKNTSCDKFLGVKIDQHLNFDNQVKAICQNASGKIKSSTSDNTIYV